MVQKSGLRLYFHKRTVYSCPFGLSGLCCHISVLIIFLKHFTETKEKIMKLTCTEQLTEMASKVPLKQINSQGTKRKKNSHSACRFKRNISNLICNVKKILRKKPIEAYFHSILVNSSVCELSSIELLSNCKFNLHVAEALTHLYCCPNKLFGSYTINVNSKKVRTIHKFII